MNGVDQAFSGSTTIYIYMYMRVRIQSMTIYYIYMRAPSSKTQQPSMHTSSRSAARSQSCPSCSSSTRARPAQYSALQRCSSPAVGGWVSDGMDVVGGRQ